MSVIATATDDSKLKKDLSALLIQLNSKSERALTHTLPEAILRLTAYHETIKSNPNSVLSDAKLQEMMETPLTRKSEESMQTSKKRKISEGEHQANGHTGVLIPLALIKLASSDWTAGTPDLTVPSPRILIEALAYLREEYDAQAAAMDSVKVWLTLHIPQIEGAFALRSCQGCCSMHPQTATTAAYKCKRVRFVSLLYLSEPKSVAQNACPS